MAASRAAGPVGRRLWVAAATAFASAAALTGVIALCAPPLAEAEERLSQGEPWSALPFELLLSSLASAALGCCGFWLALVTVATVVEALTGISSALLRQVTPAFARRAVLVCCGIAVGGTSALSPAVADPAGAADPSARAEKAASVPAPGEGSALTGLPLPDRPVGGAASSVPQPSARATRGHVGAGHSRPGITGGVSQHERRVRPGDSLWSIAEDLLPPTTRAPEVDATWRRIYRANRAVVGNDPDLLVPGTTLHLPGTTLHHPGTTADPTTPTTPRKDAS